MSAVKAVIVDIETDGLDTNTVAMFEIGMVLIDEDFEIIDTFQGVLVDGTSMMTLFNLEETANAEGVKPDLEVEPAKIVVDMHKKSGLWAELKNRAFASDYQTTAETERSAIEWLTRYDALGLPMTGSNVANFDRPVIRRLMPQLEKQFHYRNVDVSSIKEWIRAYSPERYETLRGSMAPKGLHRTVSDCVDTLAELKVYTEGLLA